MGYFDGVTELYFKKDTEGRSVFYPLGALWKGFVVADAQTEEKLRSFFKLHMGITLLVIALNGLLGMKVFIAAMVVLVTWFYFKVRSLLSGCPASAEKLSLGESYRNSAVKHDMPMLWILLLISAAFTAASFWLITARDHTSLGIGLLAASGLFFGFVTCAIGYMIKVKFSGGKKA